MTWFEMKLWLVQSLQLDKDALHIYAAISVQLLVAILFRRSLASPIPWIAALGIILVNEYMDYQVINTNRHSIEVYRAAAWHDMWNTMLLPTALFLLARYWPALLSNRYGRQQPDESDQSH